MNDEAVKSRFVHWGGVPNATAPQELTQLISQDRQRYAKIIQSKKITAH
jgi:tripartite-type tricarboxylate transporter receptor subunit TctC